MAMDTIYDSAKDFAAALDKLVDVVAVESDTAIRLAVLKVADKIQKDTPRDTSRARAGWILTSDEPSDTVPLSGLSNYMVEEIRDPGRSMMSQYWLVNNVEYISILEDGSSEQAPEGMVAIALSTYDDHLNAAVDGMETIS